MQRCGVGLAMTVGLRFGASAGDGILREWLKRGCVY